MIYPYIVLADETEIVHSEIKYRNNSPYVEVTFERPDEKYCFCTAKAELPSYEWISNEHFDENDINLFTELLHSNAHLIMKYAKEGGINIA